MNRKGTLCNSGASAYNGPGPVARIITGVRLNEVHQLEMA